ncbi:MAG: SCP-2 sterol transfer family protein [Pseudomonadota bacterium]
MSELFSDAWMKSFMEQWNADPELSGALAEIDFDSVIGYGFSDQDKPVGMIKIQGGQAVEAGAYVGQELNWDLRASEDQWSKWISKPPGMMGLGTAFASGKLKFKVGDYGAMIKDPRMAGPFIKSFSIMGRA